MRGLLFAAALGLLAGVCAGQDPAQANQPSSNPPPSNQSSSSQSAPNETGQNQAGQNQPAQDQPAQDQSEPEQPAKGKNKKATSQAAKDPVPPTKPSQNKALQNLPQGNPAAITLDGNETIFSFLTALNACGYDQDLTISDATRSNVRAELQRNLRESEEAEAARSAVCEFVQGHVASKDANRNLSQYISLALYVDGPPHFVPRVKEEELPPDAAQITRVRYPDGALLRQSGAALDLGAAP